MCMFIDGGIDNISIINENKPDHSKWQGGDIFYEFFIESKPDLLLDYITNYNYNVYFIKRQILKYLNRYDEYDASRMEYLIIFLNINIRVAFKIELEIYDILPLKYQIQMLALDKDMYDCMITNIPLSYEAYDLFMKEDAISMAPFDILSPFLYRLGFFKRVAYSILWVIDGVEFK